MMKKTVMVAVVMAILIVFPAIADETESEGMDRSVDSDWFCVAHVMMAEAGYTDSQERRYVGSVLLNRTDSDRFPNSILECLYQDNPIQYSTVYDPNSMYWEEPTGECWKDAADLLEKWYETGETDLPQDVVFQSRFPQGTGTYLISAWGQYFCYQ